MSVPALPRHAAHAAWLLGGGAGRDAGSMSDADEAAFVAFLIERRLAAEIAAVLRDGHRLSRSGVRSLAIERERIRALAVAREETLRRCGAALSARDLAALLFKGEATIRLTHGDVSRRPMADIDIVARAGELPAVVDVLVAAGLVRTAHDTPLHVVLADVPVGGPGRVVHVEIHSDVLSPPHPVRVDLEGTFARAAPAPERGLLVPDPADALVLSALHLALHENDPRKTLLTLRDIALLLERMAHDGGAVERLARRVREREAGAIVERIVARAVAWAGAPEGLPCRAGRDAAPLRRRVAAALAVAEMDEALVAAHPRRWRVIGRRLGIALWAPRWTDSARGLVALAAAARAGALPGALRRQVAALTKAMTPRRSSRPPE